MNFRPLIAALLISGTVAVPALAQTGDALQIQTNDLNLASAAGRATLERRISGAERQLCMNATATGSRSRAAQEQNTCRAEVRRQVAAQFPAAGPCKGTGLIIVRGDAGKSAGAVRFLAVFRHSYGPLGAENGAIDCLESWLK